MKRTVWKRIKRQVRIIIALLQDLLVLEKSPFDDDDIAPTGAA